MLPPGVVICLEGNPTVGGRHSLARRETQYVETATGIVLKQS